MEVENNDESARSPAQMAADVIQPENLPENYLNQIIEYLIGNVNINFKNQHKDEAELTNDSKKQIALSIYNNSKSTFLSRFGQYIKSEHLDYFKQYSNVDSEGYEINYYLEQLQRFHSTSQRNTDIRNRRYHALKQMAANTTYFTEIEMMKRNPLLYEQLVGQYLTEEQRKLRNSVDSKTENVSFVDLLLEGIENETIQELKFKQEDFENEITEEIEDDDTDVEMEESIVSDKYDINKATPSVSTRWGEWDNLKDIRHDKITNCKESINRERNWFMVSDKEKELMKEEFQSHMFQQFLEGKDVDFDYTTVDFNASYDNIDVRTQDEEEKYFDSESPTEICIDAIKKGKLDENHEDSEDELDIYMKKLNEQAAISELTKNIEKI